VQLLFQKADQEIDDHSVGLQIVYSGDVDARIYHLNLPIILPLIHMTFDLHRDDPCIAVGQGYPWQTNEADVHATFPHFKIISLTNQDSS